MSHEPASTPSRKAHCPAALNSTTALVSAATVHAYLRPVSRVSSGTPSLAADLTPCSCYDKFSNTHAVLLT